MVFYQILGVLYLGFEMVILLFKKTAYRSTASSKDHFKSLNLWHFDGNFNHSVDPCKSNTGLLEKNVGPQIGVNAMLD